MSITMCGKLVFDVTHSTHILPKDKENKNTLDKIVVCGKSDRCIVALFIMLMEAGMKPFFGTLTVLASVLGMLNYSC